MKSAQDDVLIIGAGVTGLATALALSNAGRQVRVVDAGRIGAETSHGNCGTITPSHAPPLAAPGVPGRALRWNSAGGTRYRVEYSLDPAAEPFRPVPRPLAEEFDPAGYGAPSVLFFTDDFLGAASTNAERMRVYRLRILNE